jgi:tetratricopeptide (TPR) repeat protein
VAYDAPHYMDAQRFRWALAEAGRRTRALLILPYDYEDWFWSVSDAILWPIDKVVELLREAGVKHPGRIATAAGLEGTVIESLVKLLMMGYREEALLGAMLRSPDPGASLAETILAAGIEYLPLQGFRMSAPVQRRLGKLIGLRRPFQGPTISATARRYLLPPLMHEKAYKIEYILRREGRTPERWLEIARLSLDLGDFDAAAAWAEHALEDTATAPINSEAGQVLRFAVAKLDHTNWKMSDQFISVTQDEPSKALALADIELARAAARRPQLDRHVSPWMALLARLLGRAGRARDAEVMLRKLLDQPVEYDIDTTGLGLSSRDIVLSFLGSPSSKVFMPPAERRKLWDELVQVLRAQGRYLEADAMKRRRDEEGAPP